LATQNFKEPYYKGIFMKKYANLMLSLFLLSGSSILQAQDCPEGITEGCFVSGPEDDPSFNYSIGGGGFITGSNSDSSDGGDGGGGGAGATPTDPPKTPRQICLEDVDIRYTTCREVASAYYSTFLSTTCSGQGSESVNGGVPIFNGTISVDQYNQCKDIAESRTNNAMDVCSVGKAIQTASCP
jgi:hypothetical protein